MLPPSTKVALPPIFAPMSRPSSDNAACRLREAFLILS
jgi:hypothetical protein